MDNKYGPWIRQYRAHISQNRSKKLAEKLSTISYPKTLWNLSNKQEYKQLKVAKSRGLLILTSMAGHAIKIFSTKDLSKYSGTYITGLFPILEKRFSQQVIEVEFDIEEKYAFFSLTDFGKSGQMDKVVCIDLRNFKTLFEIPTGGKWCKQIEYHPDKHLLVSNWNSNDISVIDVKNIRKPQLKQLIPCGISPRGIAFTANGKTGVVAGFYSRNLTFLSYNKRDRKFYIDKISAPFDYPNYSGNMRHVVIDDSRNVAFVSNMGRNLIHKVDLKTKQIIKSFPVATLPNTIAISEDKKYLAVSCRGSDLVCVLNTDTGYIEALVDTGPTPTGLDFKFSGKRGNYDLYVTNFEDDTVLCKRLVLN